MSSPKFWDDHESAHKTIKESKVFKEKIDKWYELNETLEELNILTDLGLEEEDESVEKEVTQGLNGLNKKFQEFHLSLMFKGEHDKKNAILTVQPGAGGTESQDWAEMLLRMYSKWADLSGYNYEILDIAPGEEAGIKNVTLSISGENAYGYLRGEKGVHRLVRISPFDASNRRHTSFASVNVIPEVDDDIEIDLNESDIKMETFRSSGAGGQHVNKTDSAVRLIHEPTGVVVQCQNERSQHKNRATALKLLKAKLFEIELSKQEEELSDQRQELSDIAWGSQIRSYVLHPYNMVKDHRTEYKTGDVNRVLNGDITAFIEAYLTNKRE